MGDRPAGDRRDRPARHSGAGTDDPRHLVAAFLVLGHTAMVFGMLDPTLGGSWVAPAARGHAP